MIRRDIQLINRLGLNLRHQILKIELKLVPVPLRGAFFLRLQLVSAAVDAHSRDVDLLEVFLGVWAKEELGD